MSDILKARDAISVKNLSFSYPDGTLALDSVSFSVKEGERLGIIGGNGAGKSTLLLHLNGILTGTSGEVTIFGIPVKKKNFKKIRQMVGLVFQNPEDQLFSTTLFEDIAFGPMNMGISGKDLDYRVNETLTRFGLNAYRDKNPYHLSFGEKKIATFATVYSMRPDIYCFDEPASNLDPKSRREIIAAMKRIEKTCVVVTHDIALVEELCTEVLVLNRGCVEAKGELSAILEDKELLVKSGLL